MTGAPSVPCSERDRRVRGHGASKKVTRSAMPPTASGPETPADPGVHTYLPVCSSAARTAIQ